MVFCGKYFIPMLISNKYIFKRDIVLHYLFRIWKISVFLFFPSSKYHLNIYQNQGYPLNHINTYWYFTLNKTFFLLHSTACGILVLLGIKPVPPTLESKVLTTGPPGSPEYDFIYSSNVLLDMMIFQLVFTSVKPQELCIYRNIKLYLI